MFWLVGQTESLAKIETAHENLINALAFHPMGHMMTTCEFVDGLIQNVWQSKQAFFMCGQEDPTRLAPHPCTSGSAGLEFMWFLAWLGCPQSISTCCAPQTVHNGRLDLLQT